MAWELNRRRFMRAVNSKFIYGRLVRAHAARSETCFMFCTADSFIHSFPWLSDSCLQPFFCCIHFLNIIAQSPLLFFPFNLA
ncbi:hypothetical protein GGI43DRAFT_396689 [Trichoderma evansii]